MSVYSFLSVSAISSSDECFAFLLVDVSEDTFSIFVVCRLELSTELY